MKKAWGILVLAVLLGSAWPVLAEPLKVFVSIPPQQYIVRTVAGDLARVSVLVPPGADPHTYEPKPRQMVELSRARLYFALGLPFERVWLPKVTKDLPGLTVVHMEADIEQPAGHDEDRDHEHKEAHGHNHGHAHQGDPHVWTSPPLVRIMARATAQALARVDPAHAAEYAAGQAKLEAQMDALDAEIKAMFKGLEGRSFLVFHPAWGHFARAYGLRQIAVEVEGKEPKPAQLKELIEEGRVLGARVVLVQPQFSRRSAETVARALPGRVVVADPLAEDLPANLRRVATEIREALR